MYDHEKKSDEKNWREHAKVTMTNKICQSVTRILGMIDRLSICQGPDGVVKHRRPKDGQRRVRFNSKAENDKQAGRSQYETSLVPRTLHRNFYHSIPERR